MPEARLWHAMDGRALRCPANCKHEYQDRKYGKGVRLCNPAKSPGQYPMWRCIVCRTKFEAGGK